MTRQLSLCFASTYELYSPMLFMSSLSVRQSLNDLWISFKFWAEAAFGHISELDFELFFSAVLFKKLRQERASKKNTNLESIASLPLNRLGLMRRGEMEILNSSYNFRCTSFFTSAEPKCARYISSLNADFN